MTKVWDPSIRLFHWTMVLLLGGLWLTGEISAVYIHQFLGFALLALVVYRILWGFFGTRYARFSEFIRSPKALISYLPQMLPKVKEQPHLSHNPAGGIAVVAMLILLLGQITTGMLSIDDGFFSGPFVHWIGEDQAESMAEIHEIIFTLLQFIVVVHVAAVLWHQLVKKDPLIPAMVKGQKPHAGTDYEYSVAKSLVVAVVSFAAVFGVIFGLGQVSMPL